MKSPRDGDNQLLYKVVCFFLLKKMPWCSEIPLQDNVHILVYVWCSSFVQYIVLVKFFALQHVSIFNDLHRPWECLIQCILPERVLSNYDRQDEMVRKWKEMRCEVFFSEVSQLTRWVDLLISKEATSQNKAFCTSPQWNIYFFLFSLFCFPILFSYFSIFFGMVNKFELNPSLSFKTLGTK